MNRKFADIHVHPSLKPFNNRKYQEGIGKTIWDKFDERESDIKELSSPIRSVAKELAKSSQANLDACVEARLACLFLALYPVERQWFDARPKKPFKLLFRLFLSPKKYHHLGAAVSGFPTDFVKKIMRRIKERKGIDYFNEELLPLLDYILDQTNCKSKNYPYYSFKIATNYTEYKQFTNSDNIICGILTIEGGNSLGNYMSHNTFYKEFDDLGYSEKQNLSADFKDNVNTLKSWRGGTYTPFFISFCHHFNNLLAGHSRSLTSGKVYMPGFGDLLDQEPGLGKGFNKLGKRILYFLLSKKNGRRILIDTKHMSIHSRVEYHDFVKVRRSMKKDNIPIIQSHASINGFRSFSDACSHPERKNSDKDAYFSRSHINLNDEEIFDIYDSDGLIGIVFHEGRMPGGLVKDRTKKLRKRYNRLHEKEYLSVRQQEKYEETKEKLKLIYTELIWSNIFHIIRLIHNNRYDIQGRPANGWKIISIGSDYDGMVDPFNGYFSVSDLPSLFKDMTDFLREYISNRKGAIYYADNGRHHEFQRDVIVPLMFGKKPEDILKDICFNNADLFLSKYFTIKYLT